ncbi:MAG: ABC transporter permease [Propioniciclava sp.]
MSTTSAPPPGPAARARSARFDAVTLLQRYGIVVPFLMVGAVCVALVPSFLSNANVANVMVNASIMAIIGYGMTIVIALRGLDLSVGSVQGLAACVTATVIAQAGLGLGMIAGLFTGVVVGTLNGILVAYLRVPSFVATLGTLGVVRGSALLVTGGGTVDGADPVLSYLATGRIAGIPIPFLMAVLLLGVWQVIYQYTPFGRHVCAVGGAPEAAADSGINVRLVTLVAFLASSMSAAFGGVLLTGQLGLVTGSLGVSLELQIIAIAVLGGTSLAGGSGNLTGTLMAALLLAMISSALNLLNVPSYYQYLAIGILLIFALSLDSVRRYLYRKRLLEG